MYEEIDLRPYINALLKRWALILIGGVITAITTYFALRFVPLKYEATALVLASAQDDLFEFDSSIRSRSEPEPYSSYPGLALSDGLLSDLLGRTNSNVSNVSIEGLREQLSATSGDDPRIIVLKSETKDPEAAAFLTNEWADTFVVWTNLAYGSQNNETLQFYENELEEGETALRLAEDILIDYQSINQTAVISNTLSIFLRTQNNHLTRLTEIDALTLELNGMRQYFELNNSDSLSFADQLTLFSLQSQVFSTNDKPLIIQISPDSYVSSANRREQFSAIEALIGTLVTQKLDIQTSLSKLETEIMNQQQFLEEAIVEYHRLQREMLIAEETFTLLARRVAEERIVAQDVNSRLVVLSYAAIPKTPINRSTLVIILIAFAVGISISSSIVLALAWWQTGISNGVQNTIND